jgi:hypothetical protein
LGREKKICFNGILGVKALFGRQDRKRVEIEKV